MRNLTCCPCADFAAFSAHCVCSFQFLTPRAAKAWVEIDVLSQMELLPVTAGRRDSTDLFNPTARINRGLQLHFCTVGSEGETFCWFFTENDTIGSNEKKKIMQKKKRNTLKRLMLSESMQNRFACYSDALWNYPSVCLSDLGFFQRFLN